MKNTFNLVFDFIKTKTNIKTILVLLIIILSLWTFIFQRFEIQKAKSELLEKNKTNLETIKKEYDSLLIKAESEKQKEDKYILLAAEAKKNKELNIWKSRCILQNSNLFLAWKQQENCEENLERFANYESELK